MFLSKRDQDRYIYIKKGNRVNKPTLYTLRMNVDHDQSLIFLFSKVLHHRFLGFLADLGCTVRDKTFSFVPTKSN